MFSSSFFLLKKTRASIVARDPEPLTKRLAPTPLRRKWSKAPEGLKRPYLVRPFQKDGHLAAIQHIEYRGMYREELDIERARFPRTSRTVAIQCDGALTEREAEFTLPPVLVVFRDRHSVNLEQLSEHRRLGSTGWRCLRGSAGAAKVGPKPVEDHERKYNVLTFPYCVPTSLPMRRQSLLVKPKTSITGEPEGKSGSSSA